MESKASISAERTNSRENDENIQQGKTHVHVVFFSLSYDDFETKSTTKNEPIESLDLLDYLHLSFI